MSNVLFNNAHNTLKNQNLKNEVKPQLMNDISVKFDNRSIYFNTLKLLKQNIYFAELKFAMA